MTDSSSDLHPHRPHLHPAPPTTHPSGYELRLKQLEGQLSDLLQRSKVPDHSMEDHLDATCSCVKPGCVWVIASILQGSRKQAKPTTTKHSKLIMTQIAKITCAVGQHSHPNDITPIGLIPRPSLFPTHPTSSFLNACSYHATIMESLQCTYIHPHTLTGSYNSSESDQSDSDPVRPGCARQSTKTSWTSLAAERTGPQQFTAKSTSQRRQRTCTKVSRTKKPKGTPLSGSHGNIAAHDRSVSHRSDVNRGANQAGSSPSPSEHPRGISSPSADMKKKTKLLMETQRGRSQERRRDDTSVQVLQG